MGARTCEHSVVGVVVIGQGRGESFNVCIAKKKCEVHWGSKIRAAKKNAAKRAAPGAEGEKARDRYAKEDARRKAAEAKKEAERARYKKVVPALLDALAAAVKKAPTKATGLLASVVIDACEDYRRSSKKASARVPVGTTADDLIRHVAFIVLQGELSNEYHGPTRAPKICKAFGLDAKKIIDEASPSAAGVCKKCGCTETTPCDDGGLPCAWTDKTETLCTACNKPKKKAAAKRRKKAKR